MDDDTWQREVREAMVALDRGKMTEIVERAVSTFDGGKLVDLIEKGLSPGLTILGDKFGRSEIFIPELIVAAEMMKAALKLIDPKLRTSNIKRGSLGKVVLATVRGDLHEIGKTIVGCLLTAKGFEVVDLGIDVPTREIVDTAKDVHADIIGTSALLTTTLAAQRELIEMLKSENRRDAYKVMVGGAAVSGAWAKEIGADAYGSNAQEAVELALGFSKARVHGGKRP